MVESSRDAAGDDAKVERQIETVVQSLQGRFGAAVEPERIRAEVVAEFAMYSHARVRDFVPIRVETHVRSRLVDSTF